MAKTYELLALSYSPWSEKARWVLDIQRVPYRETAWTPMLGEPWLRARLRKFRGKVSVPVFFDDAGFHEDSFRIAQHATAIGEGPELFPPAKLDEIQRYNDRSELLMASGRVLTMRRMHANPAAQLESLPKGLQVLGRGAQPLAAMGVSFIASKYAQTSEETSELEAAMRSVLEHTRQALSQSGGRYLLGDFSFADIAMACSLQFVAPPEGLVPLGPESRRCWTHPRLATEFADLLQWRDEIYREKRTLA